MAGKDGKSERMSSSGYGMVRLFLFSRFLVINGARECSRPPDRQTASPLLSIAGKYFILRELGSATNAMLPTLGADLWHRRNGL